MNNMNALQRIIERVARHGEFYDESTPVPLLTLDEFFNGNEIVGSIGCNLPDVPHPSEMREVLQKLENRDTTHAIYVQITEMDDPEWPFSDTVWAITKDSEEDIRTIFPENLAPDEVWEGFHEDESYEKIEIPSGYKVMAIWWD